MTVAVREYGTTTSEQGAPAIGEQRPSILEVVRNRNGGSPHGWTEARLELLKALVAENLSAKEIAEKLGGVSRNAVIGKCARDGLRLFGSLDAKRGAERARYGSKISKTRRDSNADRGMTQRLRVVAIDVPEPEMPSPDHLGIQFFDLAPHHCRFIKDATYCGQSVKADSSWCPFHHRLVYVRPTKPERRLAA